VATVRARPSTDEGARAHQIRFCFPKTGRHAHRGGTAAAEARPLTLRESARSTSTPPSLRATSPFVFRALAISRRPERGGVLVVAPGRLRAHGRAVEEMWGDRVRTRWSPSRTGISRPPGASGWRRPASCARPAGGGGGAGHSRPRRRPAPTTSCWSSSRAWLGVTPAASAAHHARRQTGVTRLLLAAGRDDQPAQRVRKHFARCSRRRARARGPPPPRVEALAPVRRRRRSLDVIAVRAPPRRTPSTYEERSAFLDRFGLRGTAPPSVILRLEQGVRARDSRDAQGGDPVFRAREKHRDREQHARRDAARRGPRPRLHAHVLTRAWRARRGKSRSVRRDGAVIRDGKGPLAAASLGNRRGRDDG